MSKINPGPGVSREQRISDEGLQRLERQLQRGAKLSATVRKQWVKRYGQQAAEIMKKYGQGPGKQ